MIGLLQYGYDPWSYLLPYILRLIVGLAVAFAAGLAVYWDAKNQGDDSARSWALGVFFFMIVFLPLYVIFRAIGRIGVNCPNCTIATSKRFSGCKHCGAVLALGTPQLKITEPSLRNISARFCSECGVKIPHDSSFCEECGAKLQ